MIHPEPELAVRRRVVLLSLVVSLTAACAEAGPNETVTNEEGDSPLSEVGSLFEGAPSNDELPSEGKADAVYPPQFDLVATQSPVRSQASRGVCSIFATVALMEHLYIVGNALEGPDFSEQYLQWSAKNEVRAFTNTEGSNANSNLQAISRFGIPLEGDWPYETTRWNASNDPRCTGGENLPTVCYTNGDPPESARTATKYRLPAGRWVNSTAQSLKGHMTSKNTGVVVGLDFFYQAWNHRLSPLPTTQENWREGIVLPPNEDDERESRMKPAGHAILLVGWDDDLEVPRRDGQGQIVKDEAGNPVMERGFFLFKNSWGTASFGINNRFGAGYGWIAYRYVEDYGTAYVSGVPEGSSTPERCGNGADDDGDGRADCMDTDCAMDAACMGGGTTMSTFESTAAMDIPDSVAAGIQSEIAVAERGTVRAISVDVQIDHPYRGDLVVKLVHAGREVVLLDRRGGADDDVRQTFTPTEFGGLELSGPWTLVVADTARSDVGRLERWTLRVTH